MRSRWEVRQKMPKMLLLHHLKHWQLMTTLSIYYIVKLFFFSLALLKWHDEIATFHQQVLVLLHFLNHSLFTFHLSINSPSSPLLTLRLHLFLSVSFYPLCLSHVLHRSIDRCKLMHTVCVCVCMSRQIIFTQRALVYTLCLLLPGNFVSSTFHCHTDNGKT